MGAPHRREVADRFDGAGGRILSFVFGRPGMKRHLVDLFESGWPLRTASEVHFDGRDVVFGRRRVDPAIGHGEHKLRLLEFGRMTLRHHLDALFVHSIQIQLVQLASRISFVLFELFKLCDHGEFLA